MSFWNGSHWIPDEPTADAPTRHRSVRLAGAATEAALITVLVFGVIAGSALAAKGGGRGNITVPDGVFGGSVTATLNPGGDTWAYAACYQDGTLVYGQYVRADNDHATFTLGPTPLWTGGSASCTADELSWQKNGRWHTVASTTFSATDPN